jgi:hypothetical protein
MVHLKAVVQVQKETTHSSLRVDDSEGPIVIETDPEWPRAAVLISVGNRQWRVLARELLDAVEAVTRLLESEGM